MPRKEDKYLPRELGVTRRDMLKRGALVGGTLLWVAPVIQSVGPAAFGGTLRPHKCCFCSNHRRANHSPPTQCQNNGNSATAADCASFCASLGYRTSEFCESNSPTTCDSNGCSCN